MMTNRAQPTAGPVTFFSSSFQPDSWFFRKRNWKSKAKGSDKIPIEKQEAQQKAAAPLATAQPVFLERQK